MRQVTFCQEPLTKKSSPQQRYRGYLRVHPTSAVILTNQEFRNQPIQFHLPKILTPIFICTKTCKPYPKKIEIVQKMRCKVEVLIVERSGKVIVLKQKKNCAKLKNLAKQEK